MSPLLIKISKDFATLTDNDVYTVPERIETGVVMVVVLFLTYLLLLFSDAILRVIGKQGASVLVRVMGLILR